MLTIATEGQQNLLLRLGLAVVDILLEIRASIVQKVVLWVVNPIVSRSGIISLGPTLVSKILCNKTVGGRRKDVDEANWDDINTGRIAKMRQA